MHEKDTSAHVSDTLAPPSDGNQSRSISPSGSTTSLKRGYDFTEDLTEDVVEEGSSKPGKRRLRKEKMLASRGQNQEQDLARKPSGKSKHVRRQERKTTESIRREAELKVKEDKERQANYNTGYIRGEEDQADKDREKEKNFAQKLLSELIGDDNTPIYIDYIARDEVYLDHLITMEHEIGDSLSTKDLESIEEQPKWISKCGIHLGWDKEKEQIVFVVRIRPQENLRKEEISSMDTMMRVTQAMYEIRANASHRHPMKLPESHTDTSNASFQSKPPQGKMFSAGWRNSFETGTTLAAYAPKKTLDAVQAFSDSTVNLAKVVESFKEGLCSLHPHAYQELKTISIERQVPSFGEIYFNGVDPFESFANSLTITRNDFYNFLHKDRDFIGVAYGWWWAARYDRNEGRYMIDNNCDHDQIKGGAFLWGAYKTSVDFQRCKGLVEIYWRGLQDEHCTMKSESPANITRFGSSTQLTSQGVSAVERFWSKGGPREILKTFDDRMMAAKSSLTK